MEVAQEIGISQAQVSRLEKNALKPCVIICVHKMIIQDPYSEKQPGPIPARLPYISFKIYRFPPLSNEVLIRL